MRRSRLPLPEYAGDSSAYAVLSIPNLCEKYNSAEQSKRLQEGSVKAFRENRTLRSAGSGMASWISILRRRLRASTDFLCFGPVFLMIQISHDCYYLRDKYKHKLAKYRERQLLSNAIFEKEKLWNADHHIIFAAAE